MLIVSILVLDTSVDASTVCVVRVLVAVRAEAVFIADKLDGSDGKYKTFICKWTIALCKHNL